MLRYLVIVLFVVSVGCTRVTVTPIPSYISLNSICIVENKAVVLDDFLPVLEDGFERHSISTAVVDSKDSDNCKYYLTYTALQSWDIRRYLSHAELYLWDNGKKIASAEYHLIGKGGLSHDKWMPTDEKMSPVIDELLTGKKTD